jgi:hypothetical protein
MPGVLAGSRAVFFLPEFVRGFGFVFGGYVVNVTGFFTYQVNEGSHG